jgi:hypothetical protein
MWMYVATVSALFFLAACGSRAPPRGPAPSERQPREVTVADAGLVDVQPPDEAANVVVGPGATKEETVFSIQAAACQIRWTYYVAGVNQGIARHRTSGECSLLSLRDARVSIERLLQRIAATEGSGKLRTLLLSVGAFPEMSMRMAILAKHSPNWDVGKGAPRSGFMNAVVGDLASGGAFLEEWSEAFHRVGLKITRCSVEDVTVERAGKLPYFERLKADGIQAQDRVPVDGPLWFELANE